MNGSRQLWIVTGVYLDVGVTKLPAYDSEPFICASCLNELPVFDAYLNIVDSAIRY
jgi:hypothetical protein